MRNRNQIVLAIAALIIAASPGLIVYSALLMTEPLAAFELRARGAGAIPPAA